METKTNWTTQLADTLTKLEMNGIHLGIEIAKIKNEYYYAILIKYLQGDDKDSGSLYLSNLKPLYDKYGYDKVNRILLKLEEKEQTNE